MSKKILVVDDEESIVEFLDSILQKEGFQVVTAFRGDDALDMARAESPDMVLLDVMLPGIDGFQVCRQLREKSDVPVILLTARDEDIDKILGLEMGADDYMVKPFNPKELVARMNAIFRRIEAFRKTARQKIQVLDLTLDIFRRKIWQGERQVELTPKEFDLFLALASSPDRIFSREELLREVWGYEFVDSRSVDVHIKYIREKLGKPLSEWIQTVWGKGYRFGDPASARK
jgi:DNA-binding response OmpR family regulator